MCICMCIQQVASNEAADNALVMTIPENLTKRLPHTCGHGSMSHNYHATHASQQGMYGLASSNNVRTSVCSSPALPVKKPRTRIRCLVGLPAESWPTNLLLLCTYSSSVLSLNNSRQSPSTIAVVRRNLSAICYCGAFGMY
jgi:hypothetical protein